MMYEYEIKDVRIKLCESRTLYSDKPIKNSNDVALFLLDDLKDADREVVYVINVDKENKPINVNLVSIGDTDYAVLSPKSIFKSTLLSNATGIVLAHNHVSGQTSPSLQDVSATERISKACKIMSIDFLDHVILGQEVYSMREHYRDLFS